MTIIAELRNSAMVSRLRAEPGTIQEGWLWPWITVPRGTRRRTSGS